MFNNKNLLRSMKKMTFIVCAAMLASAVLFTGCKKDENEPSKAPSVKTDIAISLPGQVGGARFMPGKNVQTDGQTHFASNGMKGITLVPFAPSAVVTTSSTRLGDNIVLGTIGTTQPYTSSPNGRARVFEAQQVPQGTSAFLFYGESAASETKYFQKGSLTGSLAGEPSAFTFSLKQIQSNASTVESNEAYVKLIEYLNAVAEATDGVKVWKDITAVGEDETFYEFFQLYQSLTALSSFGVQRMMDDFYKSLKVLDETAGNALAGAIRDSIASPRFATVDASDNVTLLPALQNFPQVVSLPAGAVAVAYDAVTTKKFGGNAAHAFGNLEPAQVDRYVYPASLWYFANSKIKTSTSSKAANYTGADSWKAILETYEKNDASVTMQTRSIAIKDTIQYAVARLDVKVKTKEGTQLEDNNPITSQNKIDNPALGWPLKAVLVGGQKNVGFDFTPNTYAGGSGVAYTIYDSIMTSDIYALTSDYSAANSTLVLETAADEDEYIALEFENNSGTDFYGVNGIVPNGGRFYLVGKLLASAATETGNKVFKQDYTTTVRVSIKDLKNAYNVIPNLKSPQLEIGLSVDLEWRAGHTYDLEL